MHVWMRELLVCYFLLIWRAWGWGVGVMRGLAYLVCAPVSSGARV